MTVTPLDRDAFAAATAAEIARFADLLDTADLAAPVPTCPDWDLDGLAKHVGVIHRWAAQMIRDALTDRLEFREIEGRALAEGQSRADWLREGGDFLVGQLRAYPADTPVWTWGPGGTVGWWARRMAFETFVHRSDALLALGAEPELDPPCTSTRPTRTASGWSPSRPPARPDVDLSRVLPKPPGLVGVGAVG